MPRKLKLTWIGSLKQWKKVYKGNQLWLGTGKAKDDMQSYMLALEEFERRKVKIDAESRAADKTSLYAPWRNQLASRPGVDPTDYFGGKKVHMADPSIPETTDEEMFASMGVLTTTYPFAPKPPSPPGSKTMDESITNYLADQKQRYLHGVKFPKSPQSQRIGGQRYIAYEYNAGLMTECWKDKPLPKSEADLAKLMIQFRNECKTLLTTGEIKASTYNERVKTLRHFIGWLHENYLIDAMPRKISEICAKYKTESSARAIDVAIIKKLFNAADDTLKLFITLGLNCGFYVGDIAFMTAENIQGQYLRYDRHKTGVPIRYKLWPITQELLKKHPPGKTTYFETADGEPLLVIDVEKKQRRSKIDNKFSVLCLKLKIKNVSFSNLRDTSATWFESDPNHRNLADLFEAHKDSTMARFYKDMSKVDVDKLFSPLDKATDELEKYYNLTLVENGYRLTYLFWGVIAPTIVIVQQTPMVVQSHGAIRFFYTGIRSLQLKTTGCNSNVCALVDVLRNSSVYAFLQFHWRDIHT